MSTFIRDVDPSALLAVLEPSRYSTFLSVQSLPDEILREHIFPNLLNLHTIAAAERVCRRWRRLVYPAQRHLSFFGARRASAQFIEKVFRSCPGATSVCFDMLSDAILQVLSNFVFVSINTVSVVDLAPPVGIQQILDAFPAMQTLGLHSTSYAPAAEALLPLFSHLKAAALPSCFRSNLNGGLEPFLDLLPNLRELHLEYETTQLFSVPRRI